MKYMGSKNRLAKFLLPIILKDRRPNQWYVEPFVGGANMIDKVDGLRLGSDLNKYLISFLEGIKKGKKYSKITKEQYMSIKNEYKNNKYPLDLIGYAGICVSYSGVWFSSYAGKVKTRGGFRDYQDEAIRNIEKQNLSGIIFKHSSYKDLEIPKESIIYCDPPYKNTSGYLNTFNHTEFWEWCREKKKEGHTIFISEYDAPDDFKCVWEKEVKSSLSGRGSKTSIEKLFTL